nr:hypothetical protein [Lachnospiraceae bacterium]
KPVSWRDELNRYFEKGAEKKQSYELGLEIEHFIVKKDTLEAVPYEGEFKGVHKGRPNNEDLKAVAALARKVKEELEK